MQGGGRAAGEAMDAGDASCHPAMTECLPLRSRHTVMPPAALPGPCHGVKAPALRGKGLLRVWWTLLGSAPASLWPFGLRCACTSASSICAAPHHHRPARTRASCTALPITPVNLPASITSVKENPSDFFPKRSLRGKRLSRVQLSDAS